MSLLDTIADLDSATQAALVDVMSADLMTREVNR